MKLRPITFAQKSALADCVDWLASARWAAQFADCPKLATKIRSALKSARGAWRHAQRRPLT